MDAVTKSADQTSDEMRDEIDSTRSVLVDKLSALEDRVMGTVESAQETVDDSIQIAKNTMATIKRAFDIKHQVEQHPWTMLGGSFLAGLALSTLFFRAWRRPNPTPDRLAGKRPAYSPGPALPADLRANASIGSAALQPPSQVQSPSRSRMFDLFQDEIAQVQGMAIGYVMGLARDAMRDAVPQWASRIDALMNSVTTKLGGEPAQQHSS